MKSQKFTVVSGRGDRHIIYASYYTIDDNGYVMFYKRQDKSLDTRLYMFFRPDSISTEYDVD